MSDETRTGPEASGPVPAAEREILLLAAAAGRADLPLARAVLMEVARLLQDRPKVAGEG